MRRIRLYSILFFSLISFAAYSQKKCISGIYPELVMSNSYGECGTGAVVAWNGMLYAMTYPPHEFYSTDDKLYKIDKDFNMQICKESVGGTNANRFIHSKSNQLIIGPYFIDAKHNIRVIPRNVMPGRLTGTCAHLSNPDEKVYFATMEEALYEVDVNTLQVKEIIRDSNLKKAPKGSENSKAKKSDLFGYHGKGLYSGFGKIYYANNGVKGKDVETNPYIKSGSLAYFDETMQDWISICEKQFTEITSKDGICPNLDENNPIYALGFDAKSVILMLNENGDWTRFRLPKSSHSYDGSHGWNTEWPRIRQIGKKYDLLMTMHGAFWNFPKDFSSKNTGGIYQRSNYLKVVGDFCKWNNFIVLGCDDTAQKEFYNRRNLKSPMASPLKSNSNLVFLKESDLDNFGDCMARGSLLLREDFAKDSISDPMLIGGFDKRILQIVNDSNESVSFDILADYGDGNFSKIKEVSVAANSTLFENLKDLKIQWLKLKALSDCEKVSVHFDLSNAYRNKDYSMFNNLAKIGTKCGKSAALLLSGESSLGAFAFNEDENGQVKELGLYAIDKKLNIKKSFDKVFEQKIKEAAPTSMGISFTEKGILIEEDKCLYMLPRNPAYDFEGDFGERRFAREVVTERDILNCAGTFYELPAKNAQGIAKIRPISSHNYDILDFCSYAGLMFISGVDNKSAKIPSENLVVSDDGQIALFACSIDDLWKMGKPIGDVYAFFNEDVKNNQQSPRCLLTGYDKKQLEIECESDFRGTIQIDIDGTNLWANFKDIEVKAGKKTLIDLGDKCVGYWIRINANSDANKLTAKFIYK